MQEKLEKKPWDIPIGQKVQSTLLDRIEPNLPVPWEHVRMLDLGAGNGRYSTIFSQKVPKEQILTIEADLVRVKALQQQGFTSVVASTKGDMEFIPDSSLHLVFSSNVLEHVSFPAYKKYLSEVHRVLVSGGVFFIGMPNYPWKRFYDVYRALTEKKNRKYYLFDDPTHINKLSIKAVVEDLNMYFTKVHLQPGFFRLNKRVRKRFGAIDHDHFLSTFCYKYAGIALKK